MSHGQNNIVLGREKARVKDKGGNSERTMLFHNFCKFRKTFDDYGRLALIINNTAKS